MRVLHFLDTLGRGGAEMQALDVARNASRFDIEVTVVSGGGGALEDDFRNSGVELIKLKRRLPFDPILASQIRTIINKREIEIVHGYQPVDGLHLFAATLGMKNVRKVLSFQGFIQDRKNRSTAKFLIPRMDANIVVSRGLQNWLSKTDDLDTATKFSVIYNGADPQRLAPTGRSLRAELNIDSKQKLVGMVANFYKDKRKDQMSIARAMSIAVKQFPEVHCVFAGGVEAGAEHKLEECKQFCRENSIDDRVHFLGSRTDVPDILNELDIAIMSSFYEGLPVAISEAMLVGNAMIVSDIEPHLEASQNGEFADVFETGNEHDLAEKLVSLLQDDDRRAELASRAKKYAEENLSIDSHLRELKSLYSSLLSR